MPIAGNKYQIFNEDCFATFDRLKDESIDLVLCDPPYGTTQCRWDSVIPLERMWEGITRVSKESAAICIMCCQPFTSVLISSRFDLFRYCWVWDKVNRKTGHLDAKKKPLRVTEDIAVFYRSQAAYFPIMTEGETYRASSGKGSALYSGQKQSPMTESSLRYPTNLLSIRADEPGRKRDGKKHPTEKPVELMEYMIKTYTKEGDTVLDFAMGSGTTGVACGNLKRKFVGCDNDMEHGYYQIAKERIYKAYADSSL